MATTAQLIQTLPLSRIKPPKHRVRDDLGDLSELKASIKTKGLLELLLVRPIKDCFEVVAGFRRYVCIVELGWKEVEAMVREMDDKTAFELALTENIQRKSMTWDEEGRAFEKYINENGWGSAQQLAGILNVSVGYVSERLKVVTQAPDEIIHDVKSGQLTLSHAEELTRLDNQQALLLAEKVVDVGLDSAQTSKAVGYIKRGLSVDQAVQTVLSFPDWVAPASRKSYEPVEVAREQIVLTLRQALSSVDANILIMPEGAERVRWTREVRYPLHNLIDVANRVGKQAKK